IGQPNIKRNLSGLAGRAKEEKQGDGSEDRCTEGHAPLIQHGGKRLSDTGKRDWVGKALRCEANRAERDRDVKNAEDEAGVAHTIDDEGLLASVRGRFLQEVETDQQVAAE